MALKLPRSILDLRKGYGATHVTDPQHRYIRVNPDGSISLVTASDILADLVGDTLQAGQTLFLDNSTVLDATAVATGEAAVAAGGDASSIGDANVDATGEAMVSAGGDAIAGGVDDGIALASGTAVPTAGGDAVTTATANIDATGAAGVAAGGDANASGEGIAAATGEAATAAGGDATANGGSADANAEATGTAAAAAGGNATALAVGGFTDEFTGNDGAAADSRYWDAYTGTGSGSIQGNQYQITSPAVLNSGGGIITKDAAAWVNTRFVQVDIVEQAPVSGSTRCQRIWFQDETYLPITEAKNLLLLQYQMNGSGACAVALTMYNASVQATNLMTSTSITPSSAGSLDSLKLVFISNTIVQVWWRGSQVGSNMDISAGSYPVSFIGKNVIAALDTFNSQAAVSIIGKYDNFIFSK